MKKSRFTEEQMAYALRLADRRTPMIDRCRLFGVSESTHYTWRKKCVDLMASELPRLKHLEDENARLRRSVADLALGKQILQQVVRRKILRLARGASWQAGCRRFKVSVQLSCGLELLRRPVWYAKSVAGDQRALRQRHGGKTKETSVGSTGRSAA